MGWRCGERERACGHRRRVGRALEVIGVDEGMREDSTSWRSFVSSLLERVAYGRAHGGRRPVRRLVSTVGELLPEVPCQRCMVHFMRRRARRGRPAHLVGRGRVEGRVRHGVTRIGLGQGRACRLRDGDKETQRGRQVLAWGHRRKDQVPVGTVSGRVSQTHPHEQHDRTIEPRDTQENPCRGRLPRWRERADARQRENPIRHCQRLVHPTLPGHVPTARHHERSELKTHADRQNRKCARLRALPRSASPSS